MKETEFDAALMELARPGISENAQKLLSYLEANIDDVLEAFYEIDSDGYPYNDLDRDVVGVKTGG